MNFRLIGVALLCGSSLGARADAEHDRIAAERAAANARLEEQVRDCESRFVVAPCLEAARKENRAALGQLRQQELQLDEGRRRAAAESRRKAIAERVEAQQGRVGDTAPEAPRVQVRREPPPIPIPSKHAPEMPPASHSPAATANDRASLEQRNQEKFDARAREAQAHRDAVVKRNAERAANGKVAAPLPSPRGGSAPS